MDGFADGRGSDLKRGVGRSGIDDHHAIDDGLDRLEAARQVAFLVLDDQAGVYDGLARQRPQHEIALPRPLHGRGVRDGEQVSAAHEQLEHAAHGVKIRMDGVVARSEIALESGDAVIGEANEEHAVIGHQPAQLAQRGQRIVHVLEHVDQRDQSELLDRGPLANLRVGHRFEVGHQHRHRQRARVLGHDVDVVHRECVAAEFAQAVREIRVLRADVERFRRHSAQPFAMEVRRQLAVHLAVVIRHQVPRELAVLVLLVGRFVEFGGQRRLEPAVARRTHPVGRVAEARRRRGRADRAARISQ